MSVVCISDTCGLEGSPIVRDFQIFFTNLVQDNLKKVPTTTFPETSSNHQNKH